MSGLRVSHRLCAREQGRHLHELWVQGRLLLARR